MGMGLRACQNEAERYVLVESVAKVFADRALGHDLKGTFPHENFADLKAIGYPLLTVPKAYGGLAISLSEMLKLQQLLASYCGSTALAIGWHLGVIHHLGAHGVWDEAVFAEVAHDVVENGALINNAASERATGSPTRGGRPETVALEKDGGWLLNGRKSFTTLSPELDYFVVTASIDGTEDVGNFLVRRELAGVHIDPVWDSVSMKVSGSHDLVLTDVFLKKEDLVQVNAGRKKADGWLLHVPAVYLGIAKAAEKYAVEFATSYSPNSIQGTIADIPKVKERIGEIALKRLESETILLSIAKEWEAASEDEQETFAL